MPESIDALISEAFSFLVVDLGFRQERPLRTREGVEVAFLSDVCGVRAAYEIRDAYLYVTLHRLSGGRFVRDDAIRPETALTSHSLDDILLLRSPSALVRPVYAYGSQSEYYQGRRGMVLYVSRFAQNLRDHAADVLSGDFSVFGLLDPLVKQRAKNSSPRTEGS